MSPTTRRLLMALLVLAAAGFGRLGLWQLDRLGERRAANAHAGAARAAAPVALPPVPPAVDTLAEHRVVARGEYDHGHEVILRGETAQGVPGVRIVTPLLLEPGGPAVLVDRGFLPAPDAVTVDPRGAEEPGAHAVRGLAFPVPTGPGEPVERGGRTTWRRLDLEALRRRMPYALLPVYIRQSPDSALASFPRRLEPPPLNDGPHLGYALQWFLFAGLSLAFAVLVVGRRSG